MTRRRYKSGFANDALEIALTIGRPNYVEREFIGWCTRAGEKFPIRNIIHKFPSVRRKAK